MPYRSSRLPASHSTDFPSLPSGLADGHSRRARRRRSLSNAVSYTLERLEKRRLLTTVITGTPDVGGVPQETTYEYLDGRQLDVRIAVYGQMTATLTFVHVDPMTMAMNFSDLVDPNMQNIGASLGADLFHIEINSAAPDASISIARVALPTADGPRPMQPFGAPGFTFTTNAALLVGASAPILPVTPDANTGAVLLGALQFVLPSVTATMETQTGPLTTYMGVTAGLTVDPGVNMNRFFFGGTVIGRVDIGGSINTFYAGQILTGDAVGLIQGFTPEGTLLHNFNVSGDIDNLISKGAIGTVTASASGTAGDETYLTGFRLSVTGHVGEIEAGGDNVTADFIGSATVADSANFNGTGTIQHEIEADAYETQDGTAFEGTAAENQIDMGMPSLGGKSANGAQPTYNDDIPANAQLLGTLFSSDLGHGNIQLEGALNGDARITDYDDFYGIALLGGQKITVTLSTDEANIGSLAVGLFSPEAITNSTTASIGLLVSSFNAVNSERLANQPISFTTTQPGIYYIAVGFATDGTFNGKQTITPLYEIDYTLGVTGVSEVAVGGLKATGLINFVGDEDTVANGGALVASLDAERGDIGAIISGGLFLAGDRFGGEPDSIEAAAGNIRVVQAGTDIGAETGIIGQHFSPSVVARKNVGLVQTGGIMLLNVDSTTPIGGSYQLVSAGTLMGSNLFANQSIGTIRAQSVSSSDYPIVWHVNEDNKGSDGIIDLIDVTGNPSLGNAGTFGTLAEGGPEISTGANGNVRYMEIAPTVEVFNDAFFGGQDDAVIHYAQGAAVTLTDDSGTPITFYPTKAQNNLTGDITATSTGTGTTTTSSSTGTTITSSISAGTLSALTYGIRDKGGVAIINMTETAGDIVVTTTTSGTSGGTGTTTATVTSTSVVDAEDAPVALSLTTSARGTNGSADIGTLNVAGAGESSVFNRTNDTFTLAPGAFTLPEDMSVTMTGKSPINVWNLVGSTAPMLVNTLSPANTPVPSLAGMGTVSNATSGELVNFAAENVVSLSAQTLGLAKSDTGATVAGALRINGVLPFGQQRTLVQIGGSLVAPGGLGNPITTLFGNAQSITARAGLGNVLDVGTIGSVVAGVNGIEGAIFAANPATPPNQLTGNVLSVAIGQGISFGGSGDFFNSGVFADNYIGTVSGSGADIRGTIAARLDAGGLPQPITISPITGQPIIPKNQLPHGQAIDAITLSGGGSLIGAEISNLSEFVQALQQPTPGIIDTPNAGNQGAATLFDVGSINLSGNGGIIGTEMIVGGIGSISVPNGFGMIDSFINSLNSDQIGSITLGGYGMRSCDIIGQNSIGSINLTGTGKELPITAFSKSVRASETGATVDQFNGGPLDISDDLDTFLSVTRSKPKRKGATEAGVLADTTINGTDTLGSLTAYRMLGSGSKTGVDVAPTMLVDFAQGIGKIRIKNNVTRAHVTAGGIASFDAGGTISLTNVNSTGNIADITAGAMSGSAHINATGPDGTIDYLKTTLAMGAQVAASVSIGTLSVGSNLTSTSVDSSGTFGLLQVKGSIVSGAHVRVARTLGTLNVTHNVLGGASVSAKSIKKQVIGGQVFGNIVITG